MECDFAVPSLLSSSTYTAPSDNCVPSTLLAPTAMSGIPSPSASPMPATPEPNLSPSTSVGPPPVPLAIFAISSMLPSGSIISTYTAPRSPPPVSSYLAPTAMSGTPSPSISPMAAVEYPNSPAPARDSRVLSFPTRAISRSSPLPAGAARSRRITYRAPASSPASSSPGAPTTRSSAPSRSRSPTPATARPNRSKLAMGGMCGEVPLISYELLMPPLAVSATTCTVPRTFPPGEACDAPAAMSDIPSPSRSPIPEIDEPNLSPAPNGAPLMELDSFTDPSALSRTTCTAPVLSELPGEPTAMSGIPSRSKSPIPATAEPKSWLLPACTSTDCLALPSARKKTTCAAPVTDRALGEPTAMSGIPSPSTSPMPATEAPNSAPFLALRGAEMAAPRLFVVPSALSVITRTCPCDFFGDPAAMSGTPSPSTSPMPATALPN